MVDNKKDLQSCYVREPEQLIPRYPCMEPRENISDCESSIRPKYKLSAKPKSSIIEVKPAEAGNITSARNLLNSDPRSVQITVEVEVHAIPMPTITG